jgi:hypothetical protein
MELAKCDFYFCLGAIALGMAIYVRLQKANELGHCEERYRSRHCLVIGELVELSIVMYLLESNISHKCNL